MLYASPWSRFELTTSVGICTDCIGSCKSNYNTITATVALQIAFTRYFLLYTIADQDIAFLVPNSWWAMIRNGGSICVDFTQDTIKNNEHNACFCSLNNSLHSLRNRTEKLTKGSFSYLFLKLVQKIIYLTILYVYCLYMTAVIRFLSMCFSHLLQ